MVKSFVVDLDGMRRRSDVGQKASHLRWLVRHGWTVPRTLLCPFSAHRSYLENPENLLSEVRVQLERRLDPSRAYAVRSSANVENGQSFSFAGQFATLLNVRGADAIIDAIRAVYEAARAPGLETYLEQAGIAAASVEMGVIVQEMVQPVVSGVSFSKNPITGVDETVVEAVRGLGDALHQEGVTPSRWVHRMGSWTTRPERDDIDDGLIAEVVQQTGTIEGQRGVPVDLEWVFDGEAIHWVQLRPITGLDEIPMYSNRIASEMLPGLIKPLVWSVNPDLVNGAWVALLTELVGPIGIEPAHLTKAFCYRAYFNMGAFGRIFALMGLPRTALEMMMGLEGGQTRPSFRPSVRGLRHVPRVVRFLLDKVRYERRVKALIAETREMYRQFDAVRLDQLDEAALLRSADKVRAFLHEVTYGEIIVVVAMSLYNALLNGQLRRLGVDVAGFDVTDGLLELEEYDPKGHLARLKTQFDALGEDTRLAVREGDYAALSERPELIGFRADVVAFLERFGHLSDAGNDFSLPRWREDPDWVVRTIVAFEPREMGKRLGWEQLPLRWVQRALLGPLYGRARRFRLYREAMGSLFVYGLGIVRERVLAMGDKFVGRGLLDGPEDIFYLALDEIRTAVQEGDETGWMRTESAARKADMDACRDVVLPQTVYGDAPPPLEKPGHPGISLSGIPTSPGYYEGRVSVIRRLEESHKMEEGAVLVIPYSEVSWTPLFSKAGAVIAESGGILSHSSIVAREYGLPCVVSVAGACRLRDGTLVKVDGYQGTISVHTEEA